MLEKIFLFEIENNKECIKINSSYFKISYEEAKKLKPGDTVEYTGLDNGFGIKESPPWYKTLKIGSTYKIVSVSEFR